MSTPDQPNTPPLTRKQLRELRNTGATPVVSPSTSEVPATSPDETDDGGVGAPEAAATGTAASAPEMISSPFAPRADEKERPTPEAASASAPPAAPLPRAADPAPLHTAPVPDASVDLGASPLTRRQARQQERIRTASVPVITPDLIAPGAAPAPAERPAAGSVFAPPAASGQSSPTAAGRSFAPPSVPAAAPVQAPTSAPGFASDEAAAPAASAPAASAPAASVPVSSAPASAPGAAAPVASAAAAAASAPAGARTTVIDPSPWTQHSGEDEPTSDTGWLRAAVSDDDHAPAAEPASAPADRAVLNPMFGARLLAGAQPEPDASSSFEQLLTRDTSTTGSATAPHALILSHATGAPLVAPIAGTGELLVTGTLALPEGLGSTGHARGTADGREVDAVLVDGELPAHSSPTPIAASAAVSTIKAADEIIQPPTPERGGRLMVSLAITAGVLALALVGVLVYALASGVIS
ncbi:hypothetical protein [Microbacterium sp.]|uniref:hypothetical protein n=1 Tax=Microbacterium sp. TaxID=51671 RepID=UPI003A8D99C2